MALKFNDRLKIRWSTQGPVQALARPQGDVGATVGVVVIGAHTWNDAPLRLDDETISVPVGPHSGTAEIEGEAVRLLVPRPNAG
jgi:hypothetical protein